MTKPTAEHIEYAREVARRALNLAAANFEELVAQRDRLVEQAAAMPFGSPRARIEIDIMNVQSRLVSACHHYNRALRDADLVRQARIDLIEWAS